MIEMSDVHMILLIRSIVDIQLIKVYVSVDSSLHRSPRLLNVFSAMLTIAAIKWKADFRGEKESYALYYTLVLQCPEIECI